MEDTQAVGTDCTPEGDDGTTARVRYLHGVAVVTPQLEKLDLSTASEFKRQLAAVPDGSLVLDMEGIVFVDSSGLGAILSLMRSLNERGGDLRLCCLQKRVRVMFELVRMHRVLNIHQTTDEAASALAADAAKDTESSTDRP